MKKFPQKENKNSLQWIDKGTQDEDTDANNEEIVAVILLDDCNYSISKPLSVGHSSVFSVYRALFIAENNKSSKNENENKKEKKNTFLYASHFP